MPYRLLQAILFIACAGCSMMPDYELAQTAEEQGDIATARYHFKALAEMGMPEAQAGYGDILRHEDTPDSRKAAEEWYLRAEQQNYPHIYGRLGKLYASYVEEGNLAYVKKAEKNLMLALQNGEYSILPNLIELYFMVPERFSLTVQELQSLINKISKYDYAYGRYAAALYYYYSGQGEQKAKKIVELCQPIIQYIPGCYLEITRAYHADPNLGNMQRWIPRVKAAFYEKRIDEYDIWKIANWLSEETQSLPGYSFELLTIIEGIHHRARLEKAKLLYNYPGFKSPDELLKLLEQALDDGSPEAELLAGQVYLYGNQVAADPITAEKHFLKARSEIAKADYYLGEMYYKGYFGRSDPELALKYYLSAARRGYAYADYALAEMFWKGEGNQPNPVYALSFISIAAQQSDSENIQSLYNTITAFTDATQKAQARTLWHKEMRERKNLRLAGN